MTTHRWQSWYVSARCNRSGVQDNGPVTRSGVQEPRALPRSSRGTEGAQRLRLRRAADVAVVESTDTGQCNDAAALW